METEQITRPNRSVKLGQPRLEMAALRKKMTQEIEKINNKITQH